MIQLSAYKEHYKETIRLGVPIMLGQLGIIIVGFADNIMVGHHSYYRRLACQQGISQSRRDIEEQSFYQLHRRGIVKYFDAPAPVEHRYFKTAGRVDAIYRSLLYLTAFLGDIRHAVQFV